MLHICSMGHDIIAKPNNVLQFFFSEQLSRQDVRSAFDLTEREVQILSGNNAAAADQLSQTTIDRIQRRALDKIAQAFRSAVQTRELVNCLREENHILREENELLKSRLKSLLPEEKIRMSQAQLLRSSVDILCLDMRTRNVLESRSVKLIAQLLRYSDHDFRQMRNMGEKSIIRLKDALEAVGLELAERKK